MIVATKNQQKNWVTAFSLISLDDRKSATNAQMWVVTDPKSMISWPEVLSVA